MDYLRSIDGWEWEVLFLRFRVLMSWSSYDMIRCVAHAVTRSRCAQGLV